MSRGNAYGLTIMSTSFPLGLRPGGSDVDVVVHKEELGTPPLWAVDGDAYVGRDSNEILLVWGDRVTLSIRRGSRIAFDSAPDVEERLVRQCILGPGLGVLMHQRQTIVLHASAVSVGDQAIIFIGAKLAGKSTTAAILVSRGHDLITDDVAVIDISAVARPRIRRGPSELRLRQDVATSLPQKDGSWRTSPGGRTLWEPGKAVDKDCFPVAAICILGTGPTMGIESSSPRRSLVALLENLYAPRFAGPSCIEPTHFRSLASIASSVPTYVLTRTEDLRDLDRIADAIHDLVLSIASPSD
jgi:hypothetical protein